MKELEKKDNMSDKSIALLDAVGCIFLVPTVLLGIAAVAGDSLNLIIGFVLCFWGVIVFALFGVLSSMAQNLIEIRKNMEKE
jgi:hypothetical protein